MLLFSLYFDKIKTLIRSISIWSLRFCLSVGFLEQSALSTGIYLFSCFFVFVFFFWGTKPTRFEFAEMKCATVSGSTAEKPSEDSNKNKHGERRWLLTRTNRNYPPKVWLGADCFISKCWTWQTLSGAQGHDLYFLLKEIVVWNKVPTFVLYIRYSSEEDVYLKSVTEHLLKTEGKNVWLNYKFNTTIYTGNYFTIKL